MRSGCWLTVARRWLLAGLVLLVGSALAQTLPDHAPVQTLGVVTCASSLCHGSIAGWDGSPVQQNQYIVWSRLDKHARAYALLLNAKSASASVGCLPGLPCAPSSRLRAQTGIGARGGRWHWL
mgnify:CR=1 FL=1